MEPEEALRKALKQLDDMFRGRDWLDGGGCTGRGDWENHPKSRQQFTSAEGEECILAHPDQDVDAGKREQEAAKESNMKKYGVESTAIAESYVGGLVHDWGSEPFVRGGYCYPRLDYDENTHADAAFALGDTLFFAGEHTNTPMGMSMHAAIDSGER